MLERQELTSRIADAAAKLDYAEESFEKLAALTEAIHALADKPRIGGNLARIAHDMAEELAASFCNFKEEYDSECRRLLHDEQSSLGQS